MIRVNALFAPAEVVALQGRDLSQTACVVFDVLRATSTLLTALARGATAVIPVGDIAEALRWRILHPEVLLGGEREGRRIDAATSGGTEFDFGNSPREYTEARVAGRTIICTTTNGTRALRGCSHGAVVFPAAFLNLAATARALRELALPDLLLIGAGTAEEAAYEDIIAIGALVETLGEDLESSQCADTVHLARAAYGAARADLCSAVATNSKNGRRLLRLPDLAEDVALCLTENSLNFAARLDAGGAIRRLP